MGFLSDLDNMLNKKKSNEVRHGIFGDLTLWMVLIVIAGMLYVTKGVLSETNIATIVKLVSQAIWVFGAITVVRLIINGAIKCFEIKYYMKDGILDANELAAMNKSKEKSSIALLKNEG